MKCLIKRSVTSLIGALIMTGIFPQSLVANDSTSEKQKAYLSVKYIKEDGKGKVHFRLFTKEGNNKIPVQYSIVNLFLDEESKWGMMGNITTDANGEGEVPLRKRFATESDSMAEYHLIGSMKNDPRLMETQTKLTIKPATLELSLYQQDSVRYAKATLKEKDSAGLWVPVSGVKIDFFVKRYFTLLPTVSTDENGEALLEIPDGLKGDNLGNVKIVARIDANDSYGTLVATKEEKWGIPDKSAEPEERLLSITFIIGVWAVIIYIISQLFKKYSIESAKNKSS